MPDRPVALTRHARPSPSACSPPTPSPSAGCSLATGRDRARRLPDIVQIESTNICNAKCVFCPRDEMHRRQGVMDMELFKKIVDECAALGITHVRVHNYGEPFLDRQLVEKVRYAKQKGIEEVGMISNGSLITEEIARGMIEAGLDAINISVDAAGKEVFERTRLDLNYDKVIANIRTLVAPAQRARPHASEAHPVVRPAEQLGRRAGVHRATGARSPTRSTSPICTTGPARSTRSPTCNYPVLPPVADVHGALGRPRLALLRRLRRPAHPGRPANVDDRARSGTRRPTAPCAAQHLESGGPDICRSCDLPKKDSPLWVSRLV